MATLFLYTLGLLVLLGAVVFVLVEASRVLLPRKASPDFPPGITLSVGDDAVFTIAHFAGKATRFHRSNPSVLACVSAVVCEVALRYKRTRPKAAHVHVLLLDDEHWAPWVERLSPEHKVHTRAFVTVLGGVPAIFVRVEHLGQLLEWPEVARRLVHEALHWASGQYDVHIDPTLWGPSDATVESRARRRALAYGRG
jgi:hypothetical protein